MSNMIKYDVVFCFTDNRHSVRTLLYLQCNDITVSTNYTPAPPPMNYD